MAEADSTQPDDVAEDPLAALSDSNRDLLGLLSAILEGYGPEPGVLGDLPLLTVQPSDTLNVCRQLKEIPGVRMTQLLCLACVDYSDYFQMVYILHSLEPEKTLAVKTDVPYDLPAVPSVASVWRAAEWYEREAHDLFGVDFHGHPGLSPLLLYEGFEGFPGRKDFPFNDYQEF